MSASDFPLREFSIDDLFYGADGYVYEVPIYQRNYAWGDDEIRALVQDAYDAFSIGKGFPDKDAPYYIGTLVTFHKGKHVYEVIDGQQRLTTIYLVLTALFKLDAICALPKNQLTYRSRKRSTDTIEALGKPGFRGAANVDVGIASGFESACRAIEDIVPIVERRLYGEFFKKRVRIIFYQVPKDIDLNHYFEVMNSRGEQLEQHEVVKAALLGKLDNSADRAKFHLIWERCSQMDTYVQQGFPGDAVAIFGASRTEFLARSFDELPPVESVDAGARSIKELMNAQQEGDSPDAKANAGAKFQSIIDFPL